jgi:response regulator RpfG family c-di-GMP phosphodiesterase
VHYPSLDPELTSLALPRTRRSLPENRKVLFVVEERAALDEVRRLCEEEFVVRVVSSGSEALSVARRDGPFAVVVCDHDLPGESGPEVLRELALRWPETMRALMSESVDCELAARALDEGEVFRILNKPLRKEELRRALRAGVERHRALRTERFLCEQLQFTRETLLSFTSLLEERVEEQMEVLGRMHELSAKLNDARSIEEIARLVVHAVSRALGGPEGRRTRNHVEVETGEWVSQEVHEEPIVTDEGELGLLSVDLHGPRGQRLVRVDRQVLASLASSTSVAARNEIRRRERDEAQHATIFALARLAEHRDNETGKHLERVSEYCRIVAEGLRADGMYTDEVTDQFVADLVRSAPLHDIGKVGIPDSILLKPGKLNEEEWIVMKEHTTIGADTLRSVVERTERAVGFLQMGLDVVWCHHEKWDGTGYPRGLRELEIPLSARILALADCYDALTTKRPYKEPWPHQKAVDLIESCAGSDYDPAVVAAFLARVDRVNEVRQRLKDDLESVAVEVA